MQLENKVAVVTGASSGIGNAVALAFTQEGAAFVVNYRGHSEAARDVVEHIKNAGGRAVAVRADVTKPEEIASLAVYLASDASAYVTGSTFFIDGGMTRHAGSL